MIRALRFKRLNNKTFNTPPCKSGNKKVRNITTTSANGEKKWWRKTLLRTTIGFAVTSSIYVKVSSNYHSKYIICLVYMYMHATNSFNDMKVLLSRISI